LALQNLWPSYDVFYSLAAVLDFEVIPVEGKIERGTNSELSLKLRATEDLVAWTAHNRREDQSVIAFSLESADTWDECLERAHKKLLKKGADLIVVNRAGLSDQGPDARENSFFLLDKTSQAQELKLADKREIAKKLISLVDRHYSLLNAKALKGVSISLLNQ
jgi:phosphopantothenoylcysteine decarboxylase/phosphopantothenate--cysteine ligase